MLKLLLFNLIITSKLVSSAGFASSSLIESPYRAQIVLIKSPIRGNASGDFQKEWLERCESLGQELSQRSGYYNHGIFSQTSCHDAIISSDDFKRKQTFNWQIEIIETSSSTTISSYYYPDADDKSRRQEASLTLSQSSDFVAYTADREILRTLATVILDGLPFSKVFDPSSDGPGFVVESPVDIPPPPVEYVIYSSRFSKETKLWIPQVIGYAKRKHTAAERLALSGKDAAVEVGESKQMERYEYQTFVYRNMLTAGQIYWAHDSRGRNQIEPSDYEQVLKSSLQLNLMGFLDELVFDTFSSSYIGIRYGYPLLDGEGPITKSSMVGILTEVRGGPLNGLRWYWDFAPEKIEIIDDKEFSFSWSRASLGWSFSLGLPEILSGWFSRIDVHPKIGFMDFENRMPILNALTGDTDSSTFSSRGSMDLGVEFGIEQRTRWLLFRLWAASNFSGLIPQPDSDVKVSSQRAGIDAYYDLFQLWWDSHFSLMFFSFYENLALERRREEGQAELIVGDVFIREISFDLFFAGIGLTVSW